MKTPERWLTLYRLTGGFPLVTNRRPAMASSSSKPPSSSWVSYERSCCLLAWSVACNFTLCFLPPVLLWLMHALGGSLEEAVAAAFTFK